MEQIQCATLILRTNVLTPGQYTTYGYMEALRRSMTWNNISLRTVLGSMYDEYDLFNLQFINMTTSHDNGKADSVATTTHDQIIYIAMTGLSFVNNTYDCNLRSNSSTVTLGTFDLQYSKQFVEQNMFTFSKSQENCNIKIEYKLIFDNSPPKVDKALSDALFTFKIYGIPKSF